MMQEIYCGDNLIIMQEYISDNTIDLIYADPPFFTNRNYNIQGEDTVAYRDKWRGGIEEYISWIKPRLRECYRVLKDTGSIYLHCDYHANAHLRILMDKIFGIKNFKNEIIWKRTSAHNDPNRYGRNSDRLLFYTKSDSYIFNVIYLPYSKEYKEKFLARRDNNGNYQLMTLTGAGISKGESGSKWRDYTPTTIGRHWSVPKRIVNKLVGTEQAKKMSICERLDLLYKNGYIVFSRNNIPRFKSYLDDLAGIPCQELWIDIPAGRQISSKERLGYPTQKPEALLERIIKASSNDGDIVLDPFCGSGTTLAVAQKLNRQWIGIDLSEIAYKTTKERMKKLSTSLHCYI